MAAVNVAPAPTNIQPSATSFAPYQASAGSRNTSPISSASGTPTNISPTSPRHSNSFSTPNGQPRQLRPPKCPMYVPAVLRPTRHNLKRESSGAASDTTTKSSILPITPPRSAGSSFEDAASFHKFGIDAVSTRKMGDFGPMPGVTRIITDEWAEEKMEDVTGYPTRDHWKVRCRCFAMRHVSRACSFCGRLFRPPACTPCSPGSELQQASMHDQSGRNASFDFALQAQHYCYRLSHAALLF